jgi:hypothetical protein
MSALKKGRLFALRKYKVGLRMSDDSGSSQELIHFHKNLTIHYPAYVSLTHFFKLSIVL